MNYGPIGLADAKGIATIYDHLFNAPAQKLFAVIGVQIIQPAKAYNNTVGYLPVHTETFNQLVNRVALTNCLVMFYIWLFIIF